MLFFFLAACTSSKDDSATPATPTIEFLSPSEGDSVALGKLELSLVVEHFTLQDVAKHNEGQPEGYIEVGWTDGTTSDELTTGSTTPTIEILTAGAWTITGELYFADGDEVTEEFPDAVSAEVSITVP
jgi:hypothetical protein